MGILDSVIYYTNQTMKIAAVSAFFGLAYAGLDQMQNDFDELYKNVTGIDRRFVGGLANSIAQMDGCLCWCFFNERHSECRGLPSSNLDHMCKMLADCYTCAVMDGESDGHTCVPYDIDYQSGVGSGSDLYDSCKEQNVETAEDGWCAARACTCEGTFVENLLAYFIGGGTAVTKAGTPDLCEDAFDLEANCPVTKGPPSEKACCGTYPARHPFKTLGGDRGCCGTRTYNELTADCCDASISLVKFNCWVV